MIRSQPCSACPYRRDVPSGLWAAEDYDKMPPYDAPTMKQPMAAFRCHATPDHLCHGWAVVHSNRGHDRELLALRLLEFQGGEVIDVPASGVPLFESGTAAAEHGKADIDRPSIKAMLTGARLLNKYPRLSGPVSEEGPV